MYKGLPKDKKGPEKKPYSSVLPLSASNSNNSLLDFLNPLSNKAGLLLQWLISWGLSWCGWGLDLNPSSQQLNFATPWWWPLSSMGSVFLLALWPKCLLWGSSLGMWSLWGRMSHWLGWIRHGAQGVQVESQGSFPGLLGLGVPLICLHLKLDLRRNLAQALSQSLWICCYLKMLLYKQGSRCTNISRVPRSCIKCMVVFMAS